MRGQSGEGGVGGELRGRGVPTHRSTLCTTPTPSGPRGTSGSTRRGIGGPKLGVSPRLGLRSLTALGQTMGVSGEG